MAFMEKFRDLNHREEFFQMVTKAPLVEIGEIWQALPHKRDVYRITSLELLKDVMIFQVLSAFNFDPHFPLFIRINYRNLVFKLMPGQFKTSSNLMSCGYPTDAKAAEGRKLERTKLPKKSNLNITLRSAGRDFKVSLEDVSEGGIGIRTSMANMEYFQRSNLFQVVKVCGQAIQESATLMVKHASLRDMKDFICVGLSADSSFSQEFFEIITHEIGRNRFGEVEMMELTLS